MSNEKASKFEQWNHSMKEMTTIEDNNTWQLVDKLEDKNSIGVLYFMHCSKCMFSKCVD